MHYLVLACDYDGTLAKDGEVNEQTIAALERFVASGRQLFLVTGRELESLQQAFPRLDLFTSIVAENGALLYHPASNSETLLAEAPPRQFAQTLNERGVVPVVTGRVVVATLHPYETTAQEVMREMGLDYQIIFNKESVMILPLGVDKGTGLLAALQELKISPHNVIGVGDAENDLAFLGVCECVVAVANAVPALKEQADYVTHSKRGEGVTELIEQILADDLREIDRRMGRHREQ